MADRLCFKYVDQDSFVVDVARCAARLFLCCIFVTSDTQPVLVQMICNSNDLCEASGSTDESSRSLRAAGPTHKNTALKRRASGHVAAGGLRLCYNCAGATAGRMCADRGRVSRARGPASIHHTLHKHQRHGLKEDTALRMQVQRACITVWLGDQND